MKQDGLEEMPIFGAASEEAPQPEVRFFELVHIDDGEVAPAAGGDIKPQPMRSFASEKSREADADKVGNLGLANGLARRPVRAELASDLVVLEMKALDLVIEAAAFDGTPVNDLQAGWGGIAEVGLPVDVFEAGAGAAIGEELVGGKVRSLEAVAGGADCESKV